MYIAALRDMKWHDSKSKFWMDVYGFNMSAMRPLVFKEISIENANPSTLVSKAYLIREFDISTIQIQDTNFKSTVVIVPDSPGPITALCGWFDVIFDAPGAPTVTLSTSPESEPTHWHQSIMGLDRVIYLDEGIYH